MPPPATDPPLVSVIILAYKQPAYLNAALASITSQTHPHIEIIIIDDASGPEFTTQYHLLPNARLIINPINIGTAAISRNIAIRESRGKYIALLDHDDLWLPEKIAAQVSALEHNPNAFMHFTHYQRVDESTKPLKKQPPFGGVEGDLLRNLIVRRRQHVICCSAVMLRRSALETVGMFDETIRCSADWDMWLRMAAQGPDKVLADARPLVKYREHAAQWSKSVAAGATGAALVMQKALQWVPPQRPDLSGLIKRRHARLLRDAGQAHLECGSPTSQTMAFLRESVRIWPLDFKTYRLLWRRRIAGATSRE